MYISTSINAFDINRAGSVTILNDKPGFRKLTTYSEVTAFAQRDRFKEIVIMIPERFLTVIGNKLFLPDWKPYEEDFSESIARKVAPAWHERSFGFIPGNFHYDDEGTLHFDGELEPSKKGSDGLLFYADASMKSYAGTHGATSFKFGASGFHGVILPLSFITTARNDAQDLRKTMEKSLKKVLA